MSPLIIIGGAVILAVLIVIVGLLVARRTESREVEERLGRYEQEEVEYQSFLDTEQEEEVPQDEMAGSVIQGGRRFLNPINNMLAERKFGKNWRRKLGRANLKLTVAEFAVLHPVSAAIAFLVGFFVLFSGDLITSVLVGAIGFFFPRLYVSRMIGRRLISFEQQLPDTLGLLVNALRSGYSVLQAMEAVAKDAPEPTKTEFQRIVQEVQLGIDLPDALEHLLERLDSDDLDLVVTAINIQREVGGNLAEILEVISHTIRERIKLKGEIRVLTAQGRITGYLISFLPIGLALFLNVMNPGYMGQLFSNQSCGWPLLGVGLTLIAIGQAIISKIIDIDI